MAPLKKYNKPPLNKSVLLLNDVGYSREKLRLHSLPSRIIFRCKELSEPGIISFHLRLATNINIEPRFED